MDTGFSLQLFFGVFIIVAGLAVWYYQRNQPIPTTPLVVSRLNRRWIVPYMVGVIAQAVLVLTDLIPPDRGGFVIICGWIAIFLMIRVLSLGRLKRTVRKFDYAACMHCAYALTGLPPEGKCPECGINYCVEECQTAWRYWAKSVW